MNYTENSTLAEIVKNDTRAAKVFETYGLDFCCNGNRPLGEACGEKQIEPQKVLEDVKSATAEADTSIDFKSMDLKDLTVYIVNKHHKYIRDASPAIKSFGQRVVNAHSANHPEVIQILDLFNRLSLELDNHLHKEELVLFPYIKSLSESNKSSIPIPVPHFRTIKNPINAMEAEHSGAGDLIHEISGLSSGFTLPQDACNTFTAYYKELKNFENDLYMHIHLENNILHPGAIALEEELMNKGLIR